MLSVVTLWCALMAAGLPAAQAKKPAPPAKSAAQVKAPAPAADNYKALCLPCHGPEGKGLLPAMSFTDGIWKHGSGVPAVAATITNGAKGTLMVPFKDKLSKAEILALAKFVRAFDPALKPTVKGK